jgi:hypothetical protein
MHDNSTRLGVVTLPVYGLLVFLSTLTHQPDYRTDFHTYAEYVTTTSFLVSHLVGSILGTTIGIFGCWRWVPSWPPPANAAWRSGAWS